MWLQIQRPDPTYRILSKTPISNQNESMITTQKVTKQQFVSSHIRTKFDRCMLSSNNVEAAAARETDSSLWSLGLGAGRICTAGEGEAPPFAHRPVRRQPQGLFSHWHSSAWHLEKIGWVHPLLPVTMFTTTEIRSLTCWLRTCTMPSSYIRGNA